MQIMTKSFGVLEIDPDAVLRFPAGLPGFEHCKSFKLLHEEKADPVVHWLQSVDDPDVLFSVSDPANFSFTYDITLDDAEQALLGVEDASDLALLIVLRKRVAAAEPVALSDVVANLAAPLIINTKTRLGLQKALKGVDYTIHVRAKG